MKIICISALLAVATLSFASSPHSRDFIGKDLDEVLRHYACALNGKIALDVRRSEQESWSELQSGDGPHKDLIAWSLPDAIQKHGKAIYRVVVVMEFNREHIFIMDKELKVLASSTVHDRVWIPDSGPVRTK